MCPQLQVGHLHKLTTVQLPTLLPPECIPKFYLLSQAMELQLPSPISLTLQLRILNRHVLLQLPTFTSVNLSTNILMFTPGLTDSHTCSPGQGQCLCVAINPNYSHLLWNTILSIIPVLFNPGYKLGSSREYTNFIDASALLQDQLNESFCSSTASPQLLSPAQVVLTYSQGWELLNCFLTLLY